MPKAETKSEADTSYPLIVSLLTKLGVEVAARLTPDKAREHLAKKLAKKGLPADATPEEVALATELGFPTQLGTDSAKAMGTAVAEATDDAVARALEDRKTPPADGPVPFRLKMKNAEDRVESITPTLAAGRNKRRAERNLDGRWEIDLSAKVTDPEQPEPGSETPNPEPASKAKDAPVATKTKKGGKAKAEAAGKKTTPKTNPDAAPKTKADKPVKAAGESKPRGAAAVFRELLEGGKAIAKADVIAKVCAAGAKPASAGSYVVWAKRSTKETNPGKGGNPFGFRIEETKTEAGVKMLQRVGKAK